MPEAVKRKLLERKLNSSEVPPENRSLFGKTSILNLNIQKLRTLAQKAKFEDKKDAKEYYTIINDLDECVSSMLAVQRQANN